MEIQKKQNKTGKTYFLMVFAALVWSSAFIAGKFAVPYIPTFTLTFLRFLIAAIVLFPIMKILEMRDPENIYKLTVKDFPVFAFTGIIGMFGYHVLFFLALKYTSAINSSIIGATNPIITTLITILVLKHRPPKPQAVGILISFLGVALTISGMDLKILSGLQFNKGDIVMFAAVICWASYGVYSKVKGSHIPPVALTFYSFLVCTVTLVPFVIWEKPWTLGKVPAATVGAVIFMAVFSSVMGYLFQQIAIKDIGAARTSIFINLVPVFSMILSVTILHETLIPAKIFTTILIIIGVCVCQLSGRKESAESERH